MKIFYGIFNSKIDIGLFDLHISIAISSSFEGIHREIFWITKNSIFLDLNNVHDVLCNEIPFYMSSVHLSSQFGNCICNNILLIFV